jgi:hypothetical protein
MLRCGLATRYAPALDRWAQTARAEDHLGRVRRELRGSRCQRVNLEALRQGLPREDEDTRTVLRENVVAVGAEFNVSNVATQPRFETSLQNQRRTNTNVVTFGGSLAPRH